MDRKIQNPLMKCWLNREVLQCYMERRFTNLNPEGLESQSDIKYAVVEMLFKLFQLHFRIYSMTLIQVPNSQDFFFPLRVND